MLDLFSDRHDSILHGFVLLCFSFYVLLFLFHHLNGCFEWRMYYSPETIESFGGAIKVSCRVSKSHKVCNYQKISI